MKGHIKLLYLFAVAVTKVASLVSLLHNFGFNFCFLFFQVMSPIDEVDFSSSSVQGFFSRLGAQLNPLMAITVRPRGRCLLGQRLTILRLGASFTLGKLTPSGLHIRGRTF
uniref:Putative secreted protein n=1 Tax=Ixodes ricinus TaxID=34613 RepID=A0A090XB11_IXORI